MLLPVDKDAAEVVGDDGGDMTAARFVEIVAVGHLLMIHSDEPEKTLQWLL